MVCDESIRLNIKLNNLYDYYSIYLQWTIIWEIN